MSLPIIEHLERLLAKSEKAGPGEWKSGNRLLRVVNGDGWPAADCLTVAERDLIGIAPTGGSSPNQHDKDARMTTRRNRRARHKARTIARKEALSRIPHRSLIAYWPHRNPVRFFGGPLDGQILNLDREGSVHQFRVWAVDADSGDPFCVTHTYRRQVMAYARDWWEALHPYLREELTKNLMDRMIYED